MSTQTMATDNAPSRRANGVKVMRSKLSDVHGLAQASVNSLVKYREPVRPGQDFVARDRWTNVNARAVGCALNED